MHFLVALALSTYPTHYSVHGQRALPGAVSCGAAERLASERYEIKIRPDGIWVNGMHWQTIEDDGPDVIITYRLPNAYTGLSMLLIRGARGKVAGEIVLTGLTATRKACSDRATVLGETR